ncbi:MAG: aminotransferase class I/II-fold pyridoxal phosphate-dependent enzyme [Acidobacteriota bacterium]|nr:aminotransferase class I/II-fold pyridoxal phosphate-dependent enzyme [Blastocatellia bacterium]MDW8413621.1 aminotransferase class I/II-fold pyridoxal phosphate-dependent enzyme [Acidobacteriota bacterium]
MIKPASRTQNFTYAIRNIVVEAKRLEAEGKQIIYLNVGDPVPYGFNTPEHLVEAVAKAVRDGLNGYAPSAGIPQAREAIAAEAERRGVKISPDDVFITSGASEAADILLSAMLEPGDEVLVPCPGYPLYTAILAKLGAREVPYLLDPEDNWSPSIEAIKASISPRTRAIVIINPNNPTGAVYGKERLLQLVEIAAEHRLLIVADEVYWRMTYSEPAPPIATLVDKEVPVVTLESMSKIYLAPGWRVGWMKISNSHLMKDLLVAIRKMADARLCSPCPPQYAIKPALEGDHSFLEQVMQRFRELRDITYRRINACESLRCTLPEGAFYVMAQMRRLGEATDEEFVLSLLRQTGILFVHGSGFGMKPSEGYFRIVYLPPPEVLNKVYDTLEDFVRSWNR